MEVVDVKAGHSMGSNFFQKVAPEGVPGPLVGTHIWYLCSHARPTHCNFCREKLSGMAWHGLSCEVCRMKAHKRCASKIGNCCKWRCESSIPAESKIVDANGQLRMPHQWMEGNLPIGCKCSVCDRTCGSVLKLQDWRCIWCGTFVHEQCKASGTRFCNLGPIRLSVLPPVAVKCVNQDGEADVRWERIGGDHGGGSPLLVLVNSKSGENQGMRILAKFKRLLNPAQVIDIIAEGPEGGLKFFRKFDSFRVLVCGGDGTVGWVLTAVDFLELLSKCQIGILPLGTGNDLARVLGWGRAFDDESQLLHVIEKFERAHTRMLDRWSIMTSTADSGYAMLKKTAVFDIEKHESCIKELLDDIECANDESNIFCATRILYETVRDFINLVKQTLVVDENKLNKIEDNGVFFDQDEAQLLKLESVLRSLEMPSIVCSENREIAIEQASEDSEIPSTPSKARSQRELLLKRENSLKKAVRQLTERAKAFALKMKKENRGSVLIKREHFRKKRSKTAPGDGKNSSLIRRDASGGFLLSLHGQMPFTTFPGITEFSFGDIYSLCGSPFGTMPSVLPTLSLSPPSREFRKGSNNSVPEGFELPSIGDVEPPTPISTPTALEFPQVLPAKWLETESSAEENDDFLMPESQVGNISRSLSDSVNPSQDNVLSDSLSDLQIPLTATPVDNFLSFGTNLLKRKAYEKMKSKSDSLICHLRGTPQCPVSKPSVVSKATEKELVVPRPTSKRGVFVEKKVMNNYFGIGLDAKIALEFHNKREELPEKARSRSKLLMWYGMLGGKELLLRTFKNLDQRIRLECDGQVMRLPSLQGVVILNIPSYSGGANFWGSKKLDCSFAAQSFDDRMLEVVALFGVIHVATSRVPRLPLQKHRIAQCRHVNIVVSGDEPIPVQVDGEPWLQPPGVIEIVHKNRAQMLVHDPVFEATLRTWQEQNKVIPTTPTAVVHPHFPSLDAPSLFVEAAARLSDLLDPVQNEVHPLFSGEPFNQLVIEANRAITSALGSDFTEADNARVIKVVRTIHALTLELEPKLSLASNHTQGEGGEWLRKLNEAAASVKEDLENVERVLAVPGSSEESKEAVFIVRSETEALKDENRVKSRVKSRVAQWFRSKWSRRRRRAASADAVSVNAWKVEEVCAWINSLGFKEYRETFRTNKIDGKELLGLRPSDLKQLGVKNVAHLRQLQDAINGLQRLVGGRSKEFVQAIQKEPSSWTGKSNNNETSASSF